MKNKVDILFGMNSDEGILLSQFPQVSSRFLLKSSWSGIFHKIDLTQAVPALYPLLAADWGIFGPLVLFARFFQCRNIINLE